MAGRLAGKIAAITGAGSTGFGSCIAKRFLAEGCCVALSDVNDSQAAAIMADLGNPEKSMFTKVDASKESEVSAWLDQVSAKFGGIDVLVNNAAVFCFKPIEEITEAEWDTTLSVNVKGYAWGAKHVLPHMRKRGGGSIINMGSISSFIAQPARVPYNTSKGAILQMTRCLAMDLGKDNIRVNIICPGTHDTPALWQVHQKHFSHVPEDEFRASCVSDNFIKRIGTSEDIANAALFLASDESTFITGSPLHVDGGYLAH